MEIQPIFLGVYLGILGGIISIIIGVIFSIIGSKYQKRSKSEITQIRATMGKLNSQIQINLKESFIDSIYSDYLKRQEDSTKTVSKAFASSQLVDGSFPNLPIIPVASIGKDEINKEIEQKTSFLYDKIEEIEKRFPSDATIEKISSVNDAILATNIESLFESLKRIEDKLLSKWDVAKIVFQIIASLGGVIALAIVAIKFASDRGII